MGILATLPGSSDIFSRKKQVNSGLSCSLHLTASASHILTAIEQSRKWDFGKSGLF